MTGGNAYTSDLAARVQNRCSVNGQQRP